VVTERSPWTPYVEHAVRPLESTPRKQLLMPNFSCANLSGASFAGHALFPGQLTANRTYPSGKSNWQQGADASYADNARRFGGRYEFPVLTVTPPRFYRADLSGVDLQSPIFFAVSGEDFPSLRSYSQHVVAEFKLAMGTPNTALLANTAPATRVLDEEPFRQARRFLRASLHNANVQNALLSEPMKQFVEAGTNGKDDFDATFMVRYDNGSDPDAQCKPRAESP